MLILTRKVDQQILIDGDIKIKIVKVNGNNVRLGISAPAHIKIVRGELMSFGMETSDPALTTSDIN